MINFRNMIEDRKALTLIEILITVLITTSIVGAVYALYVIHQRTFQKGEEAGEVVQNGRVILERLSRELRQADEIVTVLQDNRENASNDILFEDGHVPVIQEEESCQGATANTITLYDGANSTDDYYKGTFVKIIANTGEGQIKEIIEYDGATRLATIKGGWEVIPDTTSIYMIDSSYYYIHYFIDGNNLKRQVLIYYFSGTPNVIVPWNAEPPEGETLKEQIISDEAVGEYVDSLELWGQPVINIALAITKGDKSIDWYTKVFGRNL